MKKRTQEEIQEQIDLIQKQKETLPEFSFFGDPNWKIADLQIEILEGKITDEDEIYDMVDEDEGFNDEHASDVCNAFQYLEGDIDSLVE